MTIIDRPSTEVAIAGGAPMASSRAKHLEFSSGPPRQLVGVIGSLQSTIRSSALCTASPPSSSSSWAVLKRC